MTDEAATARVVEFGALTLRVTLTPSAEGYLAKACGATIGSAETAEGAIVLVRDALRRAQAAAAAGDADDDPAPADARLDRAIARRETVLDEIAACEEELVALRDDLGDLDDEIEKLERRARRAASRSA